MVRRIPTRFMVNDLSAYCTGNTCMRLDLKMLLDLGARALASPNRAPPLKRFSLFVKTYAHRRYPRASSATERVFFVIPSSSNEDLLLVYHRANSPPRS